MIVGYIAFNFARYESIFDLKILLLSVYDTGGGQAAIRLKVFSE